jgi:hypothetical protein
VRAIERTLPRSLISAAGKYLRVIDESEGAMWLADTAGADHKQQQAVIRYWDEQRQEAHDRFLAALEKAGVKLKRNAKVYGAGRVDSTKVAQYIVRHQVRDTDELPSGYVDKRASAARETVRQVGGRWFLFSKSGKKLGGPYKTKGQADDREKQVQFFKHLKELWIDPVKSPERLARVKKLRKAWKKKKLSKVLGEAKGKTRRTRKPYPKGQLKRELFRLRGQFARAAQGVIDRYHPDDYGGGGICDDVAAEMGFVASRLHDVDYETHGWNDHAWVVIWNDKEAWAVDIPADVYETGAGYKWTVHQDVRVRPSDVVIYNVPLKDWLG